MSSPSWRSPRATVICLTTVFIALVRANDNQSFLLPPTKNIVGVTAPNRNMVATKNTKCTNEVTTEKATTLLDDPVAEITEPLSMEIAATEKSTEENCTEENSQMDLPKAAMNIITIVWYVATFLALASFFTLMACSDRHCHDVRTMTVTSRDMSAGPPTPSPSYSDFAPPSYESVMMMQHPPKAAASASAATTAAIFVIPFNIDSSKDNTGSNSLVSRLSEPSLSMMSFYTINEYEKGGS